MEKPKIIGQQTKTMCYNITNGGGGKADPEIRWEHTMTEFAHTYKNVTEASEKAVIDINAAFTLICHRANGEVLIVNSNESPALSDENTAVMAAMNSISDYDDFCDVFNYGMEYGTAGYCDMTPTSRYSDMQVVFSMGI